MTSDNKPYDLFTRIIHLGLMVFGIIAWLTGELAEDYEESADWGFTIHSWVGLGLALFILLRLIYGVVGPVAFRFTSWVPYNKERMQQVWDDVLSLLRFTLPHRPVHTGLSGLVQIFGLLVFSWMALTGSILFFFIEPGTETGAILHFVEELHEVGEELIPFYLVLHVGAVILHWFFDRSFIRRMF
jgi:cytochrome b